VLIQRKKDLRVDLTFIYKDIEKLKREEAKISEKNSKMIKQNREKDLQNFVIRNDIKKFKDKVEKQKKDQ